MYCVFNVVSEIIPMIKMCLARYLISEFYPFQLDVAEGDVISLLKKFKALQEERAYTYNLFHE